MNAFDLLTRWFGAASGDLRAMLEKIAAGDSELAPTAQAWLDKLNAAGDPGNLAGVATAVFEELKNIAQLKFDGRKHPSDVI